MSSEKNVPDARRKSARAASRYGPSAICMQIWTLCLFRSEQGNLTSRVELSDVSEIAKYSIPANSAGNGSGITLLPSPGRCPHRAIICSCDLPLRSQTDKCLKDAGCGRHPNSPQPLEPRRVITHRTASRRRRCMQRGVRAPGAGSRRARRAVRPTRRGSRRCNFSEICQNRNDSLWGR